MRTFLKDHFKILFENKTVESYFQRLFSFVDIAKNHT